MRITSIFILILSSLSPLASAQEITVAAAADLNYALKELAARFEQKTGDKVTLSFGSSGNLFSQIQSGAPYDLFFSADEQYPKKLAAAGLMDSASLRTYAVGSGGYVTNFRNEDFGNMACTRRFSRSD